MAKVRSLSKETGQPVQYTYTFLCWITGFQPLYIDDAWTLPNHIWARQVFLEDIKAIQDCDKVVCLYYGLYSDSGTAWECGYAYGIGKPVELLDCAGQEVSLMVVNGANNSLSFTEKSQS